NIDVEQRAEESRYRIDLIEDRVADVQVAHGAEVAHLDLARAVERRVKSRHARQESADRLAERRIQMEDLARLLRRQAEQRHGCLGALAQIDRQAYSEAEQKLQVRVAEMLDRVGQVAARQMLEAEIQVIMRGRNRLADRIQVAEVDGTRHQYLV